MVLDDHLDLEVGRSRPNSFGSRWALVQRAEHDQVRLVDFAEKRLAGTRAERAGHCRAGEASRRAMPARSVANGFPRDMVSALDGVGSA